MEEIYKNKQIIVKLTKEENTDGEYTDYICDSDPYGLRLEEFCN